MLPVAGRAERLPLRVYATADGLASDQVHRIVEDSRGFLWLATRDGLSRFDGYGFTSFGRDSGLASARVADLLESRAGTLWAATDRGLCRFAPAAAERRALFACAPVGPTTQTNRLAALHEDGAGTLWVATGDGLFRLLPERGAPLGLRARSVALPVAVPAGSLLGVEALAGGPDGDVWVGTHGGIVRLSRAGAVRQVLAIQRPLERDNNRVFGLHFDRGGRLWIGLGYDGVVVLRPEPKPAGAAGGAPLLATAPPCPETADGSGRRELALPPGAACRLTEREGLVSDFARNGFLETSDGALWIGTSRGLGRFADGRLASWGRASGLPDEAVQPQLEDSAGNLWLATEGAGAVRLARQGLTTYGPADGLAGERVVAVGETAAGRLYAVTLEPRAVHVNVFAGSGFAAVAAPLPAAVRSVGWGFHQTTAPARGGGWWVATSDGLLHFPRAREPEHLAGTEPLRYTVRDGLGGDDVFRLYEDRRGDLWVGTFGPGYLTRRDRASGRFHVYSPADGIPDAAPTAFAEDRAGGLWVGFYDGTLARFDGRAFRVVPAGSAFPAGFVHALHVDSLGRLWATCWGDGVARLDAPQAEGPPRFVRYSVAAAGLSSDHVTCIVEDARGRLHLCTGRGIDRLDVATGRVTHLSTADGLASTELRSAFRDRHGDLWFATARGLSRLRPQRERGAAPPPIRITELRIAGARQPLPQPGVEAVRGVELVAGRGSVEIAFVAPSFASGERLRYQHRLARGAAWSAPSEQRSVLLAALGPGAHRFEVRAVSADGGTSARPALVELTVLPPVYRRAWFLALVALLALAAAALAVRWRVARLVAVERVRARIATDLHDDLGASLSRISILSEVAARRLPPAAAEGAATVREIGETARSLFDSVADIVWAIDPRRDDLRNVVARLAEYAADVLERNGVRWSLEVPPEADRVHLDAEARRHLYLLLKEALHNAARHAGARAVALRVHLEDGRLVAAVDDDGGGLPPELDGSGNGLRNMRERAAALGGRLLVESAAGAGTRVAVDMPRPRLRRAGWRRIRMRLPWAARSDRKGVRP